MVGLWSYRGIFVVLLVAIVASLAVLATIRVERPTSQPILATPIDVAVTAR
jgi:HAMP domain-containing protein